MNVNEDAFQGPDGCAKNMAFVKESQPYEELDLFIDPTKTL